jgi:NADPH:quinone reductase-like Zn-dependent oxidoreductase
MSTTPTPVILGEELVGTVEVAGKNSKFKAGDKVAAWMFGGGKAHNGSYVEYAISRKECVVKIETTLDWDVVAAIPMSMFTAYGGLFISGGLKPKSTVFVHGGTSVVGMWALLLAKDIGCTVITTTRLPAKVQKLKAAGADHVLLRDADILAEMRKLAPNNFLELVGATTIETLAENSCQDNSTASGEHRKSGSVTFTDFSIAKIPSTRKLSLFTTEIANMEQPSQVLQDVVRKVEGGVFKAEFFLDNVFPLEKIGDAHEYMEENKAVGKVVVMI